MKFKSLLVEAIMFLTILMKRILWESLMLWRLTWVWKLKMMGCLRIFNLIRKLILTLSLTCHLHPRAMLPRLEESTRLRMNLDYLLFLGLLFAVRWSYLLEVVCFRNISLKEFEWLSCYSRRLQLCIFFEEKQSIGRTVENRQYISVRFV